MIKVSVTFYPSLNKISSMKFTNTHNDAKESYSFTQTYRCKNRSPMFFFCSQVISRVNAGSKNPE